MENMENSLGCLGKCWVTRHSHPLTQRDLAPWGRDIFIYIYIHVFYIEESLGVFSPPFNSQTGTKMRLFASLQNSLPPLAWARWALSSSHPWEVNAAIPTVWKRQELLTQDP